MGKARCVVADTTKVRIFKQITTWGYIFIIVGWLLLIPQRYEFSSKSQLHHSTSKKRGVVADTTKVRIFKQITTICKLLLLQIRCCWYHKGTNFQANHNYIAILEYSELVVADTTKVRIFKQITTVFKAKEILISCCWYHKGTNFQANHNKSKAMT